MLKISSAKRIQKFARNHYLVANNMLRPVINVDILPQLQDNYTYVVSDSANQVAIVIDACDDGKQILQHIEKNHEECEALAVLTTHKHWDHIGGNEYLSSKGLEIYGPSSEALSIPSISHPVNGGDKIMFGGMQVTVFDTPCHTSGHVMYFIDGVLEDDIPPSVFTGDTLFVGGCGRFFEGDATDMMHSIETISTLPPETRIFCGHEYTLSNLQFAHHIEPDNKQILDKLIWAESQRTLDRPTIPSILKEEFQYNPFLRFNSESIRNKVGSNDPVTVIDRLRTMKNKF